MSWVKLNVGGEKLETTWETLTKYPDSGLAAMVNSIKDEEDVLRLDLNPDYFRPILDWLRHGKLAVPSHLDLQLLVAVVEDLGLTELSKVIKEKDVPSLGDWIKLDVGGRIFKTTRATLTRVPDSLLGRMFDPDSILPPARMQDGAFLIDSCPSSFPVILHWLRCREVALGEVTVETALSAARYFGLQGLVEALEVMVIKMELELDSDWTITPSWRRHYDTLFDKLGPQGGLLSEEKVGNYLMPYDLPDSTLDKIWEFFDQDKDSFLDRYQFTVVVHLADIAEALGKEIPNQLPPQLSREYLATF